RQSEVFEYTTIKCVDIVSEHIIERLKETKVEFQAYLKMVYESKESQDGLTMMIRNIVEMITAEVMRNLKVMRRKGVSHRPRLCYECRKPGYLARNCPVQKFGKGSLVKSLKGSSIGGIDNVIGCVSCADVVVCGVGVNQMFYIVRELTSDVVLGMLKASFVVNEDCVIENSEDKRSDFMDIRCIKSESMENDDVDYDEKEKSEIVNIMDSDESNQMGKMKVETYLMTADGKTNDSRNCSENEMEKKKEKLTVFNNYRKSVENKHEASE
ncbi:12230_t:CDS:2, partial [Racocetra persica]